jgi:hypothetical protein
VTEDERVGHGESSGRRVGRFRCSTDKAVGSVAQVVSNTAEYWEK